MFVFVVIFTYFDTNNINTILFILLVLLVIGIITEYGILIYMAFFIIPIILMIKLVPSYQYGGGEEEGDKFHVRIVRFVKGYNKKPTFVTDNNSI